MSFHMLRCFVTRPLSPTCVRASVRLFLITKLCGNKSFFLLFISNHFQWLDLILFVFGGRRLNWERAPKKAFQLPNTHSNHRMPAESKNQTTTTIERKKNHGCVTNSYRPVTQKSTNSNWPAETGRFYIESDYHHMLFEYFTWVCLCDGYLKQKKKTFLFLTGWIAGKGFLMLVDGKFPFSAPQSGGYLRSIVKSISPAAAVQSAWEEIPLWLKTDSRQKEEVKEKIYNTSQPRPLLERQRRNLILLFLIYTKGRKEKSGPKRRCLLPEVNYQGGTHIWWDGTKKCDGIYKSGGGIRR